VIPVGSIVNGRIERIDPIPKKKRWLAGGNGDFTPARNYKLVFDSVVLPDGTQMIATEVSKGTAQAIHLVTDPNREGKKKNKSAQTAADAKQEVRDKVRSTFADIRASRNSSKQHV